jgi:hypothetical protein
MDRWCLMSHLPIYLSTMVMHKAKLRGMVCKQAEASERQDKHAKGKQREKKQRPSYGEGVYNGVLVLVPSVGASRWRRGSWAGSLKDDTITVSGLNFRPRHHSTPTHRDGAPAITAATAGDHDDDA